MVEVKKLRTFYDFCGARSAEIVQKTDGFFAILTFEEEPSAGIGVVDVKN